jgi:hypothetical protein
MVLCKNSNLNNNSGLYIDIDSCVKITEIMTNVQVGIDLTVGVYSQPHENV